MTDQAEQLGAGEPDPGALTEVASFTLVGDAHAAASALEAASIPVHLRNATVIGTLPHMANAFGGIGVCVPEAEAERAREILAGVQEGAPAEGAAGETGQAGAQEEPTEGPRDAYAKRAWRSAVLGLVFLPGLLHLVSLWHLATFARLAGPVTPRARRQAVGAAVVNALAAAVIAALMAEWRRGS